MSRHKRLKGEAESFRPLLQVLDFLLLPFLVKVTDRLGFERLPTGKHMVFVWRMCTGEHERSKIVYLYNFRGYGITHGCLTSARAVMIVTI